MRCGNLPREFLEGRLLLLDLYLHSEQLGLAFYLFDGYKWLGCPYKEPYLKGKKSPRHAYSNKKSD